MHVGSLRNGYHIKGRQQARKLPNPDTGRYGRETDSEQVPQGKDDKDFEKRVKECLLFSGGKRMGAGNSSRSDAERSNPIRRSIRGVDLRGLSPGYCYARGDVAALIVVCSMRLTACLGICVLRASACGLPGLFESGNWNEYNLNPLTRIHWRASLVPAAALVVEPLDGSPGRLVSSVGDMVMALAGRVVPPVLLL
ncbi:hypothetical protein YC2023_089215 [Brassica napus]